MYFDKGDRMERWLKIDEFSKYSISDQGRVRNDETERIMTMMQNAAGVLMAFLVRDGRQYSRGVAKLVATHFLPHTTDLNNTPMHLDGDRTNNAASNLMWRPRWYATKYLQQFEEYRTPFVNREIIEMETGRVFRDSWEAAKHFGLLESQVAKSYHTYEGSKQIYHASPTNLHFRRHT